MLSASMGPASDNAGYVPTHAVRDVHFAASMGPASDNAGYDSCSETNGFQPLTSTVARGCLRARFGGRPHPKGVRVNPLPNPLCGMREGRDERKGIKVRDVKELGVQPAADG